MLHKNFTVFDLKNIDDEIKELKKIDFESPKSTVVKIEVLFKLQNLSNTQKFYLSTLQEEFKNTFNPEKLIKTLNKFRKDTDYLDGFLKDEVFEAKKSLEQLNEEYKDIKSVKLCWIENYENSVKKVIQILEEEKNIINKQIRSSDLTKNKELSDRFLEKEKMIYEIYGAQNSILDSKAAVSRFLEKRLPNSMLYDFLNVTKLLYKYKIFSLFGLMLSGALLCIPYFLKVGKVPEISLGDLPMSLLTISILGFLCIFIFALLLLLQSYFISAISQNFPNKYIISKNIFYILTVINLLFILLIPFAYNKISVVTENFNKIIDYFFYYYLINLLISFSIFAKLSKRLSDSIISFMFTFIIDFFIIAIVFLKFEYINFMVLLYFIMFIASIRAISMSRFFEYKIIISLSFIVATLLIISALSGSFVRLISLANYNETFTIKKEFLPKSILNLPNCFYGYKFTCIDDSISNKDGITVKNLLVRIKSDGKYYLSASALKDNDFNITKESLKLYQDESLTDINIAKRTEEIFKIPACIDKNKPCFTSDDKSGEITVKNYHDMFKGFVKENNNFYINFQISEKNIIN